MTVPHLSAAERKRLGAYYTGDALVRFLVAHLVQPGCSVLDPSCGDGRFLVTAVRAGASRVVGCDVDGGALAAARAALRAADVWPELHARDFFAFEPGELPPVDLVLGNPPYIRYQRFTGEVRRRALAAARAAGASLTRLTSSWAPFVLHATRFVRPGGALGMVLPAELVQAQYGREALRALGGLFADLVVVAVDARAFPDAQEETVLVLGRGRGGRTPSARLLRVGHPEDLAALDPWSPGGVALPVDGAVSFGEALLPGEAREAWSAVLRRPEVRRLGEVGRVVNGYVSGANRFFHRTLSDAERSGLPCRWLQPAATSAASLRGLYFRPDDIVAHEAAGRPHHLVVPEASGGLFGAPDPALARFVQEGERQGIHRRTKCRRRSPWWRVPGLWRADLLVTYMAGERPRAAVNLAGAVHSNTLHGVLLPPGAPPAEALVVGLYTTVALLSMELVGRSYGGGVLKLEPTECASVRVPVPALPADAVSAAANEIDALLRRGDYDAAVARADGLFLEAGLGIPSQALDTLRRARALLVRRRVERSRRRK